MSLLETSQPAHGTALGRFARTLKKGDAHDRALLLNLQEEDRLPAARRQAFHDALVNSRRRGWKDRLAEALPVAQRAVQVPLPRPGNISGTWWNHIPFAALEKYHYVSLALHRASRPPPRLRLTRCIGRPKSGADLPVWITDVTSTSADGIRDRLGMCFVLRGEHLYRIRISLDVAPNRALYVPTAIDAGFYPAWRHPGAGHTDTWGLTRNLQSDAAAERELLALPDPADALEADYVGLVATDPPGDYLRARGIT